MTEYPDLSAPIRSAIVSDASITALLPAYLNSYPVFTRTPVPDDAPSLCIVVSHNLSSTHDDGVNDRRLLVTRTVTVTGQNPNDYRTVDQLARLIATLFHRQPRKLTVPGWNVYDVRVSLSGGQASELDQTASMTVFLTIRLASAAQ